MTARERPPTAAAEREPPPCPRCGNPARLFTPNARRDPYEAEVVYEPAWQCTRCGAIEFLDAADTPRAAGGGEA